MRHALLAAALLAPAAGAQPEPAPTPAPTNEAIERVLIDRALTQRTVRLISLDGQTLKVIDASGHTLALPIADVLALAPPLPPLDQPFVPDVKQLAESNPDADTMPQKSKSATPPPPAMGRLETVDGQVLLGTLDSDKASAKDSLTWKSRLFGTLPLPLDIVSLIIIDTERHTPITAQSTSDDTVFLRNGDRVEGFISATVPRVRVEKNGKPTDLPLARVDSLKFANPAKPASGVWVWLSDTGVLAASGLTLSDSGRATIAGRFTGMSTPPTAEVAANEVAAIAFDAAALRPLAGMDFAVTTTDTQRTWTPPPRIGDTRTSPLAAPDVELPGPMRVEWTLPANATQFSATLELPPSARLWGDCDVIIETVSSAGTPTPFATQHLGSAQPTATIGGPLNKSARLRVTIEAGPSGPIQDRVVLRRALVLTAPSPAPTPAPPKSPR